MTKQHQFQKKPQSATISTSELFQPRPFNQANTATSSDLEAEGFGQSFVQVPVRSGSREVIQPKLTIGEPRDKYEQEADIAAEVVQKLHNPRSVQAGDRMQTKPLHSRIQRLSSVVQSQSNVAGGNANDEFESSLNNARSSGQTLEPQLRMKMESAMGADFSGVKVHTDGKADRLNQSIQAKAFTTRQDVFFRQGAYEPGSRGGQELIAHELTHVVQQGGAVQQLQKAIVQCARSKRKRPNDASRILGEARYGLKNRSVSIKDWWQGYEAQHIIPYAVATEKFKLKDSEINEAWNGMMLPSGRKKAKKAKYKHQSTEKFNTRPRHIKKGVAHPEYNKVVTLLIDKFIQKNNKPKNKKLDLADAKSIADILRKQTKKLQSNQAIDDMKIQSLTSQI